MTTKTKIAIAAAVILTVVFIPFLVSYQAGAPGQKANGSQNSTTGSSKAAQSPTKTTPASGPSASDPASSGVVNAASAGDPRATLDALLPAFIQDLQGNDLAHVLQTYLPSDELQKLTNQLPLAEVAKRLDASPDNQRRMESLMQTLLSIQNQTPTYFSNETGEYARYTLNPPIGGLDAAVFSKINGLWYYTTFF